MLEWTRVYVQATLPPEPFESSVLEGARAHVNLTSHSEFLILVELEKKKKKKIKAKSAMLPVKCCQQYGSIIKQTRNKIVLKGLSTQRFIQSDYNYKLS